MTPLLPWSAAIVRERDRDGHFPISAFNGLRDVGFIARPPLTAVEAGRLFRLLATIGLGDLSVGRIFEGHVNALFLIEKFGTTAQREHYRDLATGGHIFGVWNTDTPGRTGEARRICACKAERTLPAAWTV